SHAGGRTGGTPARSSGFPPLQRQMSPARPVPILHLYQFSAPVLPRIRTVGLHPTDGGSTPERRTNRFAGLARRSSPRSIIARCWFDSNILHHFLFDKRG